MNEINHADYTRIATLVEQGYTPDEALAKIAEGPIAPATRPKKAASEPKAKTILRAYLDRHGDVITEYQFHSERKWRADYFLPEYSIIVEYDGLMANDPSHSSINGILRDAEKINAATAMGIRVFWANAKNIHDGSFFRLMDEVLEGREAS